MKKLLTKIALVVAGFSEVAIAQQDPQFTQFMYNKLIYNPGYAGTSGAVCGVAQFRQQWVGFQGSPQTIAAAADMRLKGMPIGVGVNVISDKIGTNSTTFLRLAGSYNLLNIAGGTLGMGVDLGILSQSINGDWITPEPTKPDLTIPGNSGYIPGTGLPSASNAAFSKTTFDAGLGFFYQIPGKFYAGLSTTHLPASDLQIGQLGYQVARHYYFMAGYTFQPNKWSKLTPNVLAKTDLNSSSVDLNLTYLWSDMIWVGGTYRLEDAPAILAGFQKAVGKDNAYMFKLGYSYDFTTSKLKTYAKGTHEILLGVCFTPAPKKVTFYENDRYLGY